jgi:hypothetical protein
MQPSPYFSAGPAVLVLPEANWRGIATNLMRTPDPKRPSLHATACLHFWAWRDGP